MFNKTSIFNEIIQFYCMGICIETTIIWLLWHFAG